MTGSGTDIVAVERVAALLADHGERFIERCFRSREVPDANDAVAVAEAWAAKEALLKALSADVIAVPYRDIEVLREDGGKASLHLHGEAEKSWRDGGGNAIHLALAHDDDYALAFVVIE